MLKYMDLKILLLLSIILFYFYIAMKTHKCRRNASWVKQKKWVSHQLLSMLKCVNNQHNSVRPYLNLITAHRVVILNTQISFLWSSCCNANITKNPSSSLDVAIHQRCQKSMHVNTIQWRWLNVLWPRCT